MTAKIANASFLGTLMRALALCVSLFMLMAGVFVRPELVLEPGLSQLGAAALVLVATIGFVFSLQAQFSKARALDVSVRLCLAAVALVVLLHPSMQAASLAGVGVLILVAYWVALRRRRGQVRARA